MVTTTTLITHYNTTFTIPPYHTHHNHSLPTTLLHSSSDDMSIKLWDWERDFECIQVFEGHGHYVMMVKINPRDTNTFASASLDKSIKVGGFCLLLLLLC